MSIRIRGFLSLIFFGAAFALILFWYANPDSYPFDYIPIGIGAVALIAGPGALAFIGLIEVLTGQPFYKVEESWQNLKWWQRGIGGTLFVLVGGAIAFGVVIYAFG